jgi:hypothetical protein
MTFEEENRGFSIVTVKTPHGDLWITKDVADQYGYEEDQELDGDELQKAIERNASNQLIRVNAVIDAQENTN